MSAQIQWLGHASFRISAGAAVAYIDPWKLSAAEADALSTAFYVMGPAEVERYCAGRPHLSAVLVCPTRREGAVQLHAFGLSDHQWRQLARD